MKEKQRGLKFDQLFPALARLPALPPRQPFVTRDGAKLQYRHYPSESKLDVVLIHGSAAHSLYLYKFAEALSAANAANVYTPDLRGHGVSPERRGDINYIEQLEDDLADLIAHIRSTANGQRKIIVAGHSSGGGLALRFAGGKHGSLAAGYLLLAPYLGHNAPTVRQSSGGWAVADLTKIIAIAILNAFGITRFNDTQVLRFNLPPEYRTGVETLVYSYRLMTGINPKDYKAELSAIKVPLLVLVGSEEEAFVASAFEPAIKPLVAGSTVKVVDGASHLGLVVGPQASTAAIEWLRGL